MKTPKYQYVFFITVTVLESLLAIAVSMLYASNILPYMKGTLIFLSIIGGNIAIFSLTRFFYKTAIDSALEQTAAYRDKSKELEAENKHLSDKVRELESKERDVGRLREKCNTIEYFRNSFPLNISDEYAVYNIMRTDLQTGDYSKWQIVGVYKDELWSYTLLRPDSQTFKEMLSLVSSTKEPAGLKNINLDTELLYM